jgi:DNA primase
MDRRSRVRQFLELAGARDLRVSHEGFVCRCPFHDGENGWHKSKSPSFAVNITTGRFVCFSGVCGRQGSLSTILVDLCGYPYSKAKEILQEFSTPDIPDPDSLLIPSYEERRGKRRTHTFDDQAGIAELNPAVLGIYERCPTYMLQRGFRKDILRRWDIGLTTRCMYDVYAHHAEVARVTIPVWTKRGKLAGISMRGIAPESVQSPKYLHEHFEKRLILYGENMVEEVTERHPLIVVESQPAVIWLSQAGIPNAVSTMGSKVSDVQMERIARYPYVVLAFDDDMAGYEVTQRCIYGYGKTYGRREWVPGLSQTVGRNALSVAGTYKKYRNKDDMARTAKDPQEIAEDLVSAFVEERIPWEFWEYPSISSAKRG